MSQSDAQGCETGSISSPAFTDAASVTRTLAQVTAVQSAGLCLILAASFLARAYPMHTRALAALLHNGAAGIVGGGIATSLSGTLCCLLVARARAMTVLVRNGTRLAERRNRVPGWLRRRLPSSLALVTPVTWAAGWPQSVVIFAGIALSAWLIYRFGPVHEPEAALAGPGIAGLMLLPAFLLIVCERLVADLGPDRLPEATCLTALLRLPIAVLLALSAVTMLPAFGITVTPEIQRLLAIPILAINAELAVRAGGHWLLPPPAPGRARAAVGSLLASLLQPEALRRAGIARRLREQFGIDVSRSWAVVYARKAALPILGFLMLCAWGLTGVVRIGLAERGSYERFGAPVAILYPGLHVGLPWPFGAVRRLEFGAVHAISIEADTSQSGGPAETSTADGPSPKSANRLWDQQTTTDVSYLIAGHSGTRQSFEIASVDIRVMYRIGMDNQSAARVLYGQADPDRLVRSLTGALLSRFLADTTLIQVLGERREHLAAQLRADLQGELDHRQTGLEVVALIVESMHPPAGAAVAYRSVQAAQIAASAQRSEEIGRSYATVGAAERDAHNFRDDARGAAAELLSTAEVDRTQNDADLLAYRSGGQAFTLERYFATLRAAMARAAVEIVDSRLGNDQQPLIDLRAPLPGGLGPDNP
jgi:regulator of protease activity HflC (stomatin/prohibitin superfamily)